MLTDIQKETGTALIYSGFAEILNVISYSVIDKQADRG